MSSLSFLCFPTVLCFLCRYVLRVKGDGGCLFTSLRLAFELFTALRRALKHARLGGVVSADDLDPLALPLLDGYNSLVTEQGARVRSAVVQWFREGLETPLPGSIVTREKDDGENVRRLVTRGDLLMNMLIADHGREVPETLSVQVFALEARATALETALLAIPDDEEVAKANASEEAATARAASLRARTQWETRQRLLLQYLDTISHPSEWASFAELQAWTYMSRIAHVVYTPRGDGRGLLPPQLAAVPPEGAVSKLALRARVPDDVAAMHSDTRDIRDLPLALAPAPVPAPVLPRVQPHITSPLSLSSLSSSSSSSSSSSLSQLSPFPSLVTSSPAKQHKHEQHESFDTCPSINATPPRRATKPTHESESEPQSNTSACVVPSSTPLQVQCVSFSPSEPVSHSIVAEQGLPHEDDLPYAGRLLHTGRHYSLLATAAQVLLLVRAFPSLEPMFIPLSHYVQHRML